LAVSFSSSISRGEAVFEATQLGLL